MKKKIKELPTYCERFGELPIKYERIGRNKNKSIETLLDVLNI